MSSKSFPEATKCSTAHTLVLRYGTRSVLVLLPKSYQELLTTTRAVFGVEVTSNLVFETSDLDVCQDVGVEIHPAAWEAIALTVSTIVVKKKDSASSRDGEEGGTVVLRPLHTGRRSSLTPKRAHIVASGSFNDALRPEIGPSASATSYDDLQDSLPTDDLAEEELGFHDDDLDVAPASRKGKGTMWSRPRIESDDELEDGDEEGYVEASAVVKSPPSHRIRKAVEPTFSIVPSSSKRVATSPKTVRGTGGLFSPVRPRSALIKSVPPPVLSDEEQWETKSPRANVTAPNHSSKKVAQNDDSSAQAKVKPPLKVDVTTAVGNPSAPPVARDKLLITIRHPPTEKENKFKVKSTHTVGRVLSSACLAFKLDPNGASLMLWSEEDDLETSYPCGNNLSMGSIATDGTIFTIELAK